MPNEEGSDNIINKQTFGFFSAAAIDEAVRQAKNNEDNESNEQQSDDSEDDDSDDEEDDGVDDDESDGT